MRYPAKWKGKLKIKHDGTVTWEGKKVGRVQSRPSPGAKSPGGLQTNTVFITDKSETEFASMTLAVGSLLG